MQLHHNKMVWFNERFKHLVETYKCIMQRIYPKSYGRVEGITCTTYIINRTSFSPINLKSLDELMFGKNPNVKYFRVFG